LRLEQLLNVEPLAEADGISLFVDRARAVNSAFQLTADNAAAVGELCARLDELPLAIELAASRARLLTPRAILERLGLELLRSGESDRPDRHRSLRAAVAWSYGQLSSAEQRVFRQLAVFVGGCTLDACDAVLGPVDPPGEAHETSGSVGQADQLDLLQSLVDRSLLRSEHLPNGAVRLRMLETIRSFALEQLTISGEETAVRRRHAEHFVALVGPLTDDPDLGSVDWLDCMEAEHDNIRACLRWCLDTGDNTTALTLASAVHRFWWTRGYVREGLRWLEEGLACPDGIPLNQLAWAQHAAGGLAWRQGEYARAEAHYAAGLALRREIGDPFGAAIALQGLASVARDRGDARRSVELWEECLAVFRAASNRPRIARATLKLAIALLGSGDMDRADQLLQETVTLANEIGQYWALATALAYLALVAVEVRTDYRRAGGLIKQGSSSRSTSPTAGSPYITWTLRAGSRFRRVARQERRRPCWEPAARCRSAWAPAFIQRSPGAMNAPWPRCATSCRPKHSGCLG